MEKRCSKESVFTILFLILTCLTFFFRGMFFEGEQFLYLGLFGLLGAVFFFTVPVKMTVNRGLDWFVIGMVVVYGITSFHALYLRNALVELMKYVACLLAYWIAKACFSNRKTWLLSAVYAAGVLMSLVGLGAASGLYFVEGAYDSTKNLVMSLFQYHNTSALVMSVVFLFGMSLYTKMEKLSWKLLLSVGNMIALLTVVFSESRGTWLLFPIMLCFYYFFLPKEGRWDSLPLCGTLVAAVVVMRGVGNALAQQNTAVCLLLMFLSLLISAFLCLVSETFLVKKIVWNKKQKMGILAGLVIVLVLFVMFGKYLLPQSIWHRITTFRLESKTVTERLTFYKDSFAVFKDYPWLGIGGGGWSYVYGAYQSYRYLSNSPHSFLLHLMVETGVLGILVFAYLVFTLIRLMRKLRKAETEVRQGFAPVFAAIVIIFLHSMIDIDFSFFTVTVFFWMLLGIVATLDQPKTTDSKKWKTFVCAVLSLLVAAGGTVGKVAWDSYYKTADYMQTDPMQAYHFASEAVLLDSFNSMYSITKGNIAFHLASVQEDETQLRLYAKISGDTLENAYRHNPNDHLLVHQLATFYINTGELKKGCAMIDHLLELQPLEKDTYWKIAIIYETAGQIYQQNGDMDGVKETMGRLANLWDEQKQICQEKGWSFEMNKATKDSVLQAIRIMEQIEALEEKQ